jgi:hypothetical protein
MGDPDDLKVKRPGGTLPRHHVADLGTEECAGEGRSGGDAEAGRVGFVFAGDFVSGFTAVFVGYGDGKTEGNLCQIMGRGIYDHGGLQPCLQPAEVTLGCGFGKLVQAVRASFQSGKVRLTPDDPGLQDGKTPGRDKVWTRGDWQFRQVGAVVPGIFVDEGTAHFRITSSGS